MNRGVVGAGIVAVVLVVGVSLLLLGGDPGSPPSGEPAAGTAPATTGEAAPSAPGSPTPDAPPAPDTRTGALRGRLVRGVPARPVAGTVEVLLPGEPARVAEASADGAFRVENLPRRARFTVEAAAPGTLRLRVESLRVGPADPLELGDLLLGAAVPLEIRCRDASGAPVAGATVALHAHPPWSAVAQAMDGPSDPPPPPTPFATARTGADGRAAVEVPPGTLTAVAVAPGLAPAHGTAWLREGVAASPLVLTLERPASLEGTVRTAEGAPAAGAEVRVLGAQGAGTGARLPAPSGRAGRDGAYRVEGLGPGTHAVTVVLGGVSFGCGSVQIPAVARHDIRLPPTAALRVTVVEAAGGAPVPGARVAASTWAEEGQRNSSAVAETDAAGVAHFPSLGTGSLGTVSVRAPGFLPWPDAVGAPPEPGRTLVEGRVREETARLRRGAVVRGTVKDPSGGPVPGAVVVAWHRTWWGQMQRTAPVATAPDGSFRTGPLPAGELLLLAEAPGWFAREAPENPSAMGQALSLPEAWRVTVPGEGEVTKDLVLHAGAVIEGTVTLPGGGPAAGATVTAQGVAAGAVTGPDGSFRIEGAPPGEGRLVQAAHPSGTGSATLAVPDGGAARADIALAPTGTLRGRVRREDGGPLEGAFVLLSQGKPDPNNPWQEAWRLRSATRHPVAPDGSFVAERLALTVWTALGAAPGCATTAGAPATLTAEAPEREVEIVLPAERPLEGTCSDEAGAPVGGASIFVEAAPEAMGDHYFGSRGDLGAAATTEADGGFRVGGLGPARQRVVARAPGRVEATALAKPGEGRVALVLPTGLAVEGRVVAAATGEPVAGVGIQVQFGPAGQPRSRHASTGPDGSFRVDGLPPGPCSVTAAPRWSQAPGDWCEAVLEKVEAGARDLRLEVRPGLAIAGRLVDAAGKPLAFPLQLTLVRTPAAGSPPDWTTNRGGQSKTDGTFRLGGLDAGEWDLTVQPRQTGSKDDLPSIVRRGIAAGTEGLDIVIAAGVPLEGRCTDEQGNPVGNFHLSVGPAGTGSQGQATQWVQVQADGTFRTTPLDPGATYDVTGMGAPGFVAPKATRVSPGAGPLHLVLRRGLAITGRVLLEDGAPAAGVTVRALAPGASAMEPGTTGFGTSRADGTFEVGGLGEGPYRVVAGGAGSSWAPSETAAPVAAGSSGVELRVRLGAVLAGRLADAKGAAVEGGWLGATAEGASDEPTYAALGKGGTFRFHGLVPGGYRITWMRPTGGKPADLGVHAAPQEGLVLSID